MKLPEQFMSRMKKMLGSEYDMFISSYENPRPYGLRINPLKATDRSEFPFTLSPIPWADNGFFSNRGQHPGKHPLHEAGAYYIQEPSAMSVVSLLSPKQGDIVLDLCAAPGGKSTQIAGMLCGKGLLVSNEIMPSRSQILSRNIERLGISNAVVLNETPDRLADIFPDTFDCILADAPCSGEGMFCKEEASINEWSPENIPRCARRQKQILEKADKMLKQNGVLVYSTCTFAPEEDEEILLWFIRNFPKYQVEPFTPYFPYCGDGGKKDCTICLCNGNPDFISSGLLPLTDSEKDAIRCAIRLWPHKICGEGHFAVRLKKTERNISYGNQICIAGNTNITNLSKHCASDARKAVPQHGYRHKQKSRQKNSSCMTKTEYRGLTTMLSRICKNTDFITRRPNDICMFGDEVYLLPEAAPEIAHKLHNLKVRRAGLHIASKKKDRFEPAHALAMTLHPDETCQYLELDTESATKFLHGETLSCSPDYNGWVVTGICGCSLGFGKAKNGILKNHYPKGLRLSF